MTLLNWTSFPTSTLQGEITVPGDKSISHRSIIFGSIAQGTTVIDGFLEGEDCLATLKAFQDMGVSIERPSKEQVIIHGVGKYGLKKPDQVIDCGNSGTSIRLLAGLLAAQTFDSELTGDESLVKRPMLRISKPLTEMGAQISTKEGKAPLKIKGGLTLKAIDYLMPQASAQVKSCILLAGLYADGDTQIREVGVSRNHTELMLKTFSYPVKSNGSTITINNKAECKATPLKIPGDISSAAFFIVAATIIPKSDVLITKVGINPTRIGIIEILKRMGANISIINQQYYGEELVADLRIKYAPLKGIIIGPELVPLAIDEFPILFIAAACAQGTTKIEGAEELRHKESDRIGAMVEGLNALGIDAQSFADGALIQGGTLQGGQVDSMGDHRIAMSFAIAGAVARQPIHIKNCANVATSFPNFLATASVLNLHIKEVIDNE